MTIHVSKASVKQLSLGIPKGSLQDTTFKLFGQAGFKMSVRERSYVPNVDDDELSALLIKPQEMARYVKHGILDCGLTGLDWALEEGGGYHEIAQYEYGRSSLKPVRWVVAVPKDSKIKKLKDLQGKRVATELVGYTKRYLKKHGVDAQVEFSWGATEVKPPLLADAIVELTETGSSLRANNLRIVETILESRTVFIANKDSWRDKWKRQKIENIHMLVQGAIDAQAQVGLKMNVPDAKLQTVLKILPALQQPTIAELADGKWHSVEVILQERVVREMIPKLHRAGASGIIEYPLNKVIY